MRRSRAVAAAGVVAAAFVLSALYRRAPGDDANEMDGKGGGASDGARDVSSSHPLPNADAAPKPSTGCSLVGLSPARPSLPHCGGAGGLVAWLAARFKGRTRRRR